MGRSCLCDIMDEGVWRQTRNWARVEKHEVSACVWTSQNVPTLSLEVFIITISNSRQLVFILNTLINTTSFIPQAHLCIFCYNVFLILEFNIYTTIISQNSPMYKTDIPARSEESQHLLHPACHTHSYRIHLLFHFKSDPLPWQLF